MTLLRYKSVAPALFPLMTATTAPPGLLPHVLVVDDEDGIRQLVLRYFSGNGFRVSEASDAGQARAVLEQQSVDLVLLDIGLPGEDGLALTRYLRERWHGAVIIVSGRGDPIERVIGLEIGADDYVSKPFELRELLARARSVLRRVASAAKVDSLDEPAEASHAGYRFADLRLDPGSRRLMRDNNQEIDLTTREFDLLLALVEHAGKVMNRDQLMQRLHGREAGPFDRAIDVQIGRLRQKIENDPAHPQLIKSVRGVGYLFAASAIKA